MGYRVLFPKVLIKPLTKEDDSPIIMDITPTDPARGEVMAVGTKQPLDEDSHVLKISDIVYYFPRAAKEITIEGEKLLLIEEEDVLLIENNG